MAEYGGSSSYAPGSSTTTVQTRPGGYDPTAALLALLAREKKTLDARVPLAQPVAAAPRYAATPVPVQQEEGVIETRPPARQPTGRDAAAALANRPSFVSYNHGPGMVTGYADAPEGPNTFFGGWRVTDAPGPTRFQDAPGIGNSLGSGMAPHPSAQFQQEQAAVDARNGGIDERPDWFNTGRKRALSATEKPLTDPGAKF